MHRLWSKDEGVLTNIITFNIFNPSMREYDNIEQIWINDRPQTKIETHKNTPFFIENSHFARKNWIFDAKMLFLNKNRDILHQNCYVLQFLMEFLVKMVISSRKWNISFPMSTLRYSIFESKRRFFIFEKLFQKTRSLIPKT